MASIPTSMLHMSFMITSEYNNYLVIFVEYNISFHQYCDVKYYEFKILGLKIPTGMLHMSFMITSEYNNYLVIFVEYNISFHQYCDVKYYEFNIIG